MAWLVLLAPFTLDLADLLGSRMTGLIVAAAVWSATVLIARLLDKHKQAGPAETVLRRLTYGPRRQPPRSETVPADGAVSEP